MSEAPKRILVESECGHANAYNSEDRRTWLHFPDNAPDYFYAEYVRADRIEELEAKLAKTMDALAGVDKFVRDLSPFADPSHRPAPALAKACEVYAELTGGKDE